jgi:L-asparaginase / beta-aspartyl-peptidase
MRCGVGAFILRSAVSTQGYRRKAQATSIIAEENAMPRLKLTLYLTCLGLVVCARALAAGPLVLVIHGGAGVIDPARMTAAKEASYRAGLAAALDGGYHVLESGGSSLDAVTAAVRIMEDDPQFNAGRGAVLNHAGDAELDAAIMDGAARRAGAVAAVRHVKNPIELARLVMEKSPHVMLVAEGAEDFALEQGLVLMPKSYFRVPWREQQLQEALQAEKAGRPSAPRGAPGSASMGTVGAVALDRFGNLAAATSTGGLTNKLPGRVGDSPLIGAGTYADNASCAVSGTGEGEYFIRAVVAYDICALVAYRHLKLADAVHEALGKVHAAGGSGGVIALDRAGDVVMDFNSIGMFRGARDSRGRRELGMYRDGAGR